MVCARGAKMCKSQKGQFMRNDLWTSKSWKCVQGWQAAQEAIQKLRFFFVKLCMQCLRNHDKVVFSAGHECECRARMSFDRV
jgi:maltooligosyltrehalose synthase